MFKELFELALTSGALTMTVTADSNSGKMTVIVSPKGGEAKDEPALSTPLSLTATPEDLDAGFFEAVASYRTARMSLADQVAATTEVLAAAREASVAKGSKAVSKALPRPTKVAPKADPDSDDIDDDAGPSESVPVAAAAQASGTGAAGSQSVSLFSDD